VTQTLMSLLAPGAGRSWRAHQLRETLVAWAEARGLPCDVSVTGNIAIFSPCRRFRYVVTRKISDLPRVLVGAGVNPSTADAVKNDRTLRRGIGFAELWGCGLYVMTNTSAFRATDPDDMLALGDEAVGPDNDAALALVLGAMREDDIALAAWGKHANAARAAKMQQLAAAAGVAWRCLGTNKDGSPKHPLYLRATTPLEAWPLRPDHGGGTVAPAQLPTVEGVPGPSSQGGGPSHFPGTGS
jgi:hypothetical protein